MTTRLPLTYKQADALYGVFKACIIPAKPEDIAESLVYDIMVQIFKKLRNKVEQVNPRAGYGLPLTPIEAKAYYVYFNQRTLGDVYKYEANFIQSHIHLIDKTYA